MVISDRHEILKRRVRQQKEASLMRAALALSVRLRIGEVAAADPAVESFRTPLLTDKEFVKNELRNHIEELAGRVSVSRVVHIEFDETVEPPDVVITLGPEFETDNNYKTSDHSEVF